ncbi:NADH-quinone oxidoreductase subunit N [Syntrophothermus lipocalidus]|uniref:NADH-quinone oxidoreductase subunit N n=1 Tax=Syntrophothermus lipocalidus (strain DSM 12680 / TGB-C1) TaxID=643648 RepID=D7CJF7_SYNLT|nr:NADH-quinone oxidoreductase subunit N [Syntrophothermus lipocalidus]ADI01046.1 proton-translocating NADH-quinone oxidoreductase, chain N [Syntrophothermus lipocalidus DSM 12680]
MVPLELLSTEIGLVVLGLILLGWGVLVPVRARRVQGVITSVALGAILAMTLHLYRGDTVLFGGIYHLDAWSTFFKTLFLIAGILVVLSSDLYARRFGRRTDEFYGLMVLALLGMTVMVTAGELLTLYVGMELMTISFYILAAYCVRDERSGEAGLKYLILGAVSSAVMLFGISLVYAVTGSTVLAEIAANLLTQPVLAAGVLLILAGFGFKLALVPFHMWAPDIYQGSPITVTAFLAVGSKAAALGAMLRVFTTALPETAVDWRLVVAVLAGLTMVVGNLIALVQVDIKRLLAYSSIAQAGYMLTGLAAMNDYGLKGAAFYAMIYVFANVGAFAVATAVEVDTGSTEIKAMNGLAERSPFMAAVMTVCLLSLAGIPPLAGFVGKFYLFTGAVQAGWLWLAFVGLVMSMVSVYYYLSVAKAMYIGEAGTVTRLNPGTATGLTLWVCLVATVLIGIYPAPLSLITPLP